MSSYHQIAVKFPGVNSKLLYKSDLDLKVGQLVDVPLGKRTCQGCVVESEVDPKKYLSSKSVKVKSVSTLLDNEFHLGDKELELYDWMSRYYHYSLGQLIFDCLPKFLKRPQKIDFLNGKNLPLSFNLNKKQEFIYKEIISKSLSKFSKSYIHGVTGSGKTAIYLSLINEVVSEGKSVLFLLPEINLTPQFTKTFLEHLNCPILQYHSGISNSRKFESWKFVKNTNKPLVVFGVRSSVFLPISNLGLVIVDEEHDSSFKQNDRCPYNGRDVAIKKSQIHNIPIVLGSATPTVENYFSFKKSEKSYFAIKNRVSGKFPSVELIDVREKEQDEEIWPMSSRSIDLLRSALEKKEQVLVFVNRLGFANYIQCRACGYQFTDPNTGVNLRYFKKKNILSSAHSDYQIPLPEICPECSNMTLLQQGFGTERIQEVLQNKLVNYVVDRFDRDEITNLASLEKKLDAFESGEIDVLVGTQMLSKGHNFKKVNLVLILGVDSSLNFPDFRAMEKAYQLITQVLGRAGRYSNEARVAIETLSPECSLFKHIIDHSFDGFYDEELNIRKLASFPPFSRLVLIQISSRFQERVINFSKKISKELRALSEREGLQIDILGPSPAMIERKSGQYTWIIMLKSENILHLHNMVGHFNRHSKIPSGITVKFDVDPLNCL